MINSIDKFIYYKMSLFIYFITLRPATIFYTNCILRSHNAIGKRKCGLNQA